MSEVLTATGDNLTATGDKPKLAKAPAYRFAAWIIMFISWAQIYVGMQTVATYGIQIMTDLNISNTVLSLIANGVTLTLGIMCFVSGMIGAKIGGKRTVVLGCIVQTVAGLLYFTNPTNVAFLVFIRLFQGIGAGLINAYAVSLIAAWFPIKERSLSSGIQMGMYGVAVSSTAVFCAFFNDMGLTWAQGIGTWVTVMGIVCALLVGIFYVDINKKYGVYVIDDAIQKPEEAADAGQGGETSASASKAAVIDFHKPANYKEFFTSSISWIMLVIIFCASGCAYNLGFLYPLIVPEMGYAADEVTGFLSIAMTGTIIFGPLGGLISDKVFKGKRASTLLLSFGLGALILIAFVLILMGHVAIAGITVVGFLAYGIAFMARGPMWALPSQIFEPGFFVQANGVLLFASNLGGVLFGLFAGALADAFSSYVPGMISTIIFAAIGAIAALILMKRYDA